jgi:hypothetical protein
MKIVSVKYVYDVSRKILGEIELSDSLSDREQAILRAGFFKLMDRLYATSDGAPVVLEFLRELAVITSDRHAGKETDNRKAQIMIPIQALINRMLKSRNKELRQLAQEAERALDKVHKQLLEYNKQNAHLRELLDRATVHKPDPIEVYYPDTEQTKECGWCHQMNKESNTNCWHCEGEI